MISIKINIKVVILAIFIAILMYPRTIEILIKSVKDIKTAKKLSSSTVKINNAVIDTDKCKIVFMFDGGWASVYSDAYEVMKKYNYKGNVSVIPSRIDEKQFMSYQQLSDLYLQGWDLINHSYTHKGNIYDKTDELLSDFNRARQWMQNRYIGKLSDMLVMPFGEINPYLITQLKDAGYRNVRTSENIINLDGYKIEYYPVMTVNLLTDVTTEEVEGILTDITYKSKVVIIILNKIGDKDDGSGMTYSKDQFEKILMFINQHSDEFQVINYSQLFE
ncbi:MAG: polysaccharide deacetylase family protein [Lutisporaceae bacterium]